MVAASPTIPTTRSSVEWTRRGTTSDTSHERGVGNPRSGSSILCRLGTCAQEGDYHWLEATSDRPRPPVLEVDLEVQMDEAAGGAAGIRKVIELSSARLFAAESSAPWKLVLPHPAVQSELVETCLHQRRGRTEFVEEKNTRSRDPKGGARWAPDGLPSSMAGIPRRSVGSSREARTSIRPAPDAASLTIEDLLAPGGPQIKAGQRD